MLAKWLGRRAVPAGLLVLLVLSAPGAAFVTSGTTVNEVQSEAVATATQAVEQLAAPEAEEPRPTARPSDERADPAREPKNLPRAVAKEADALLQEALVNVPIDAVVELAQRAQDAADEARRALPDLTPAKGEPVAADPEPQAAGVAPATPTRLVLGATLIAVGAAAAATFAVFWVAGSSGSVGAAAAAKGGAEMRRLLPFASPLFTRFGKDTVLGHPRREALYARILQEPGISLQALGEATGLSRTAVVHHLRLLEQQHLVVSRRVGRGRHYFENGGRYGHDQKEAYAVLQNDRSRAVAEAIRARPGMMQKTLCGELGIPPSIAHWHVTRLAQANLVQVVRQGRTVAYFPGHAMPALNGRADALPAPAPMAAPMQVAPA